MVRSGLEFILKFTEPLQRYLLSCQANSAILGRYFCTGQQQLWRGSVNFKINSRPLFAVIFKLKNDNFKTRDFSPLIKRVITGVSQAAGVATHSCLCACTFHPHIYCARWMRASTAQGRWNREAGISKVSQRCHYRVKYSKLARPLSNLLLLSIFIHTFTHVKKKNLM